MTDNQQYPEQNNMEPNVRFGAEPGQTMPLSWAEGMLGDLFAADPARFGRILAGYVTGIKQPGPGRKAGGHS